MITMTEKESSYVGFIKSVRKDVTVRCEECLSPISVWTHQVRSCPCCYTPIPDMGLMARDLRYRITFYLGRGTHNGHNN